VGLWVFVDVGLFWVLFGGAGVCLGFSYSPSSMQEVQIQTEQHPEFCTFSGWVSLPPLS